MEPHVSLDSRVSMTICCGYWDNSQRIPSLHSHLRKNTFSALGEHCAFRDTCLCLHLYCKIPSGFMEVTLPCKILSPILQGWQNHSIFLLLFCSPFPSLNSYSYSSFCPFPVTEVLLHLLLSPLIHSLPCQKDMKMKFNTTFKVSLM